jgi:hypothetical protein
LQPGEIGVYNKIYFFGKEPKKKIQVPVEEFMDIESA